MQALKILNFCFGFFLIFLASSAGIFLAQSSSSGILLEKELLHSWLYLLQKSSHAHTNLFGLLHIAFGQTLTSSSCSLILKRWQTFGLALGSFSMSALLFVRSFFPPGEIDYLGGVMGICLGFSLCAIATHFLGLFRKLLTL